MAQSHCIIIGTGALGCTAADWLSRAGVGRITLIDRDVVELTNLQRQTLFTEADLGRPKAEAAADRLRAVNSDIHVEPLAVDFSSRNALDIISRAGDAPVLVDGTDNFEARYLINDVAVKLSLVYVYGGAVGVRGMVATFFPGHACLRCIFPDPPAPGSQPTCDTAGVLGPIIGAVASLQAAAAMAALLGRPDSQALTEIELWPLRTRSIALEQNPQCACCALRQFDFLSRPAQDDTTPMCGNTAVQVWPPRSGAPLDLDALAARLSSVATLHRSRLMLRATIAEGSQQLDLSIFADGRALIRGTNRPDRARTIYARYIGA